MKQIQPLTLWVNGKVLQANILFLYASSVILGLSANFYYELKSDNRENLASGSISMEGEDYQKWNSDEFAWDWAAQTLGLTIIGDVPVPILPVIEPVIDEPIADAPVTDAPVV